MTNVPAFTPVQPVLAQPVQRTAEQHAAATETKKQRKSRLAATNKKALAAATAKFSDNKQPEVLSAQAPHTVGPRKPDRKPRKAKTNGKAAPAKRQRTMRVAPMQMDATTALTAMLDLSRKDLAAMAKMVELLNPLSRPARLKLLAALQRVANQ